MVGVVSELLHVPPTFPERTTLPPAQNVVVPPAVITDATTAGAIVTAITLEVTLPPQSLVFVTE